MSTPDLPSRARSLLDGRGYYTTDDQFRERSIPLLSQLADAVEAMRSTLQLLADRGCVRMVGITCRHDFEQRGDWCSPCVAAHALSGAGGGG